MNKKIPDIRESVNELEKMLHQTRDADKKLRLNMLLLIKSQESKTRIAVAKRLGVGRNTTGRWLSQYEQGGIETLLEKQSPGCPKGQRTLPKEVYNSLKEKLKESSGFASYIDVRSWVKQEHGIEVPYSTLHKIVRRELQAKLKVPRKSHKEQDEKEIADFRNGLSDQLSSLAKDKEASSIRVFVQDESRFGLMPIIRRRITIKGVKPIQKVQHKFDNYYLYGAVEPISGDSFFLEMPNLNSDCFQIFLDEFHASYPDDFIIMPLDNGAFHKAKKLAIPDNIMLLFIPPYSPELNPIERLWQDIKDQISCSLYETLDELKEAVAEVLRRYSYLDIASLTGYQYIVDAANAL